MDGSRSAVRYRYPLGEEDVDLCMRYGVFGSFFARPSVGLTMASSKRASEESSLIAKRIPCSG